MGLREMLTENLMRLRKKKAEEAQLSDDDRIKALEATRLGGAPGEAAQTAKKIKVRKTALEEAAQ